MYFCCILIIAKFAYVYCEHAGEETMKEGGIGVSNKSAIIYIKEKKVNCEFVGCAMETRLQGN